MLALELVERDIDDHEALSKAAEMERAHQLHQVPPRVTAAAVVSILPILTVFIVCQKGSSAPW